jgi:hypothetical protein
MTIIASKQPLLAVDPSHIHMHHHWIQWVILMHINMLMLPHLFWIFSDHHIAVKLALLLGELKQNTSGKPPAGLNSPSIKFWCLNKLSFSLGWAKMARR